MKHIALSLLMFSISVAAQTQTTQQAPSIQAGNCSIAGAGYVSNVKIVCEGIPQKDADKLLNILHELLRNNTATDAKLDSIQARLDELRIESAQQDMGNLGVRAIDLARDITQMLNTYNSMDESRNPDFIKHHSTDEVTKAHDYYEKSLGVEFMMRFWPRLRQLQQEFALHNYRSITLDQLANEIDLKNKLPNRDDFPVIRPELDIIRVCLKRLASEVPSPPASLQLIPEAPDFLCSN
ncbi:MAG TPA: hypothetical protein VHT24_11520 [Pseudacidobacterium sp.]|jgi:hypothetical protein|nr:hypothetical protein [Pseudacidobacterium sp.]